MYTDIRDHLIVNHKDSKKIFDLYEKLSEKCAEYLEDKELVNRPKLVFLKKRVESKNKNQR